MNPGKNISIIIFTLVAMALISLNTEAQVQVGVGVTVRVAPPPLPVYIQPPCPVEGFIWIPGYWAYGTDDYYWVPGVWVRPPRFGYLWTPGYWGLVGGFYGFHPGYWGPHIGFYGGVRYGYGYWGSGFYGGRWEGNVFRYNTAVMNVNSTVVHNTYRDRTVINNSAVNRSSFNGEGGIMARPTAQEEAVSREMHVAPTSEQTSHELYASRDRNQLASVNKGNPATMAMNKVGGRAFNSKGIASRSLNQKQEGTNKAGHATRERNRRQNREYSNSKTEGEGRG